MREANVTHELSRIKVPQWPRCCHLVARAHLGNSIRDQILLLLLLLASAA